MTKEETIVEEVKETPEAEASSEQEEMKKPSEEAAEETEAEEAAEESESEEQEEKEPEKKAQNPEDEAITQKYMRLAADFQNFKRRTEKEKTDIYQYANEKIALDVIEVMDNFERALSHLDDVQDRNFAEGVEKIYKQLSGVLDKNNILEIKAEGEQFDPNFHNAVMAEENPDYESGVVIQAMQKGYTLNGKVIRPSMVRVAQ